MISLQRNRDPAEVGGELHSCFWPPQRNDDAILVLQMNATHTPKQGTAAAGSTVSASKVANLAYPGGPPFEPADGCADRGTQAETGHSEPVVAAAIRQDACPRTGADHHARLREVQSDIA